MDPSIHRGERPVAEAYRLFADREAHGVSVVYEEWARTVATDPMLRNLIEPLPPAKRQPNLVFAAARLHGADTTVDSFRSTMVGHWDAVRSTVLSHATQTNEAARTAVMLPYLAALPQPLALIEVGAAAGLCLLPDRYSFVYGDTRLDPSDGPSTVVIECALDGIAPPVALPQIVWRAGIDLAPIDVTDPDACAWLETLIWPGQEERRDRLTAALRIARVNPMRIERGDLVELLPALASEAPADATLVVIHTAVLAYLSADDRTRFVDLVTGLDGHWISSEGNGVVHSVSGLAEDDKRFVLAVDGRPRALVDPHGRSASGVL